jgi:ABC-type uncharacterized transport system substrate-binding protein
MRPTALRLARSAAIGAAALLALVPAGEPRAHPHVFIDGGADFHFDAEGRLSAIRVTWILDPFVSLFLLEALGLDPEGDGALTREEEARIVADQTTWAEGYEGDSYLWVGGEKAALGGPEDGAASFDGTQLTLHFTRSLAEPAAVPAGAEGAVVKLYDPVFFYAYFATEEPEIVNGPGGCEAAIRPFEPTTELAALQQSLLSIGRDATPEQPDVGRLFADRIVLSCG